MATQDYIWIVRWLLGSMFTWKICRLFQAESLLPPESAYRIIPVHPQDRHLLGMQFDGNLYVDMALPLGLRSAPKIFTALADGLLWIMTRHNIQAALHYLDDYIFFGAQIAGRKITETKVVNTAVEN